jgi:hypothetical protein
LGRSGVVNGADERYQVMQHWWVDLGAAFLKSPAGLVADPAEGADGSQHHVTELACDRCQIQRRNDGV